MPLFEQDYFDYLYKQQLHSGTYVIYEIAGKVSYYINTRKRAETIYRHKAADGTITWKTLEGETDEWIQAVGEGIERYIKLS